MFGRPDPESPSLKVSLMSLLLSDLVALCGLSAIFWTSSGLLTGVLVRLNRTPCVLEQVQVSYYNVIEEQPPLSQHASGLYLFFYIRILHCENTSFVEKPDEIFI